MNRIILLCSLLTYSLLTSAQIRLTEIAPTNTGQIADEDGDRPDWLEIHNFGNSVLNLGGWSLSDGSKDGHWLLPPLDLQPNERLVVFASGKNRGTLTPLSGGVNHWETAIYENNLWRWRLGATPPPANWNQLGFNDSGWTNSPGGFGYGDDDDGTQVPTGTITVYYRRTFIVADTAQLVRAVLSIDYDDGFVAYLNGQEIARSSNLSGTPTNTTLAVPEHEAVFYTGGVPDAFSLDAAILDALLRPGDNVLAVELHNNAANSSDLTGRTWLHFGIASAQLFFGAPPSWFDPGGGGFSGTLHTDFKLNFSEKITLYNAAGEIADSVSIGYLQPGHTRMRLNDDGQWCVTASPTPGAFNTGTCFVEYAATPDFALPAGFYNGQQSVALTGGGQIRYTTDGSVPTETSPLYSAPIVVNTTKVLRARRFEQFKLPSQVATATYFINEPTTLSVVSVSLPPDDFSEIYDNYSKKGALAVEFFDKSKQRQFAGEYAGYVVGNWSVSFPQKSLQFDVDEEFGSVGEIEYPIFPDKPIEKFHSFRIRNEDDDHNLTRMRDRIANELAAPTHAGRSSYRNVAAFINGEYWGHYVARERLDNYFCRDNYGADPDSVNMVKTHFGEGDYVAEYGTIDDFFAMSDFIANNNMSSPANFQEASQLLDLENFTDYFIAEIYVANTDWLQDYFNNFRQFKAGKNDRWKFIMWDVSYSAGNASACVDCDVLDNTLSNQSRYGKIFNSLLDNPEYRRHFINRFADLMNTAFLPARALSLVNTNAAELAPEIERQHDRWGTGTFGHWSSKLNDLREFYEERPTFQRQHILENFQLVKNVSITLQANPPGAGVVKISTVVPQTLPWAGIYFHGNPVTVTAIPNAGYTFSNWSANPFISNAASKTFTADVSQSTTFTANFTGASQGISLSISEINYHSDSTRDAGDWFEIQNTATSSLDISGFSVKDKDWFHRFDVPTGTVILPNERLVFFENEGKFAGENPSVTGKIGSVNFELSDQNDEIHLFDRAGNEVAKASYADKKPWPCTPDGFGRTLERESGNNDPNLPTSWFEGCVGGSPGAVFSPCNENPTVTEINYKSASNADAGDWIELFNRSNAPLDLGGWQIRDDKNDHQFNIPAGTTIPAGGFHVFYQDGAKFAAQFPDVTNKTGPLGFGLNGDGDLIQLYDPAGRLQLSLCFNDASPWPSSPDGEGYTLEIEDISRLLNDPFNWFAGCLGGSPGTAYDPDCGVVIGTNDPTAHSSALRVWPNPASEAVLVQMDNENAAQVRLLDVFGKMILEEKMVGGQARLATDGLPAGVYWVEVIANERAKTAKVVLR